MGLPRVSSVEDGYKLINDYHRDTIVGGQIKNLKPLATQHERLRKSLEQLYERVFGGPTPCEFSMRP